MLVQIDSQVLRPAHDILPIDIGGKRHLFQLLADAARFETGLNALGVLDGHLAKRSFLVGDSCTIADLSVFAYTHVAAEAGFDLTAFAAVGDWLERVCALPGFFDDLVPYPENALPGRGRSIYDWRR